MGKGHAWINGNSIGRFWPARITDSNGCGTECDYRGKYNERKCLSNCGNPSQRWYKHHLSHNIGLPATNYSQNPKPDTIYVMYL